MPMKSYKDLIVWQKSMVMAKEAYEATRHFSKDEIYGLTSQMRRSAVSIPSNIAEGWGRQSKGDYIHFLKVAQGSAAEFETQLILSSEIGYMAKETLDPLLNKLGEIQKMLNSLIRSLSSDTQFSKRPKLPHII
jgi:four helix bundle protein